jgi:hypothetical protein
MNSIVKFVLRIAIGLLGVAGLLAAVNSLIFPGAGIFIATIGLTVGLWKITYLIGYKPEPSDNSEIVKTKIFANQFRIIVIFMIAGILIAKLGEAIINA